MGVRFKMSIPDVVKENTVGNDMPLLFFVVLLLGSLLIIKPCDADVVAPAVHGTITNPQDPRVQEAIHRPLPDISTMPDWIKNLLVPIPAGEFEMGSDKSDASADEKPVHRVVVSAFYMMNVEVTNGFWKQVTGEKAPSRAGFDGDDQPVVDVTYTQAVTLADKLTEKLSQYLGDKFSFRLPTEAEWEFAARGPGHKEYGTASGGISTDEANYADSQIGKTANANDVRYKPNGWGLYQMSGNVLEWVFDEYFSLDKNYYEECLHQGIVVNPRGSRNYGSNFSHAARGGSHITSKRHLRVTYRMAINKSASGNDLGFRLVLTTLMEPLPLPHFPWPRSNVDGN